MSKRGILLSAKQIDIISLHDSSQLNRCEMSHKLRKELGLSERLSSLKIKCGMHTELCPLVFINEDRFCLTIPTHIREKLHLPLHDFSIQCKMSHHILHLGPTIAILTEINDKDDHVHFGTIHGFCEEMALLCEAKGILFYVFSLSGYSKDRVTGYYFFQNKWHKTTIPFPDVVHNRIHSRKREHSNQFLFVTTDLIAKNIPYFNNRYLNKWEVHQILSAADHLLPYLPESKLLESRQDFEHMLSVKKDLFVKPIYGSLGKRIFRVKEMEDRSFHLDFTTFSGELTHEYESFIQLYKTLYPRLKKEQFLLQETIQLKKYKNRTLDFRILCHKKNYQAWSVSSAVARVSGSNQIVSNLARGGELLPLKNVLEEIFSKKEARNLRKILTELSLEIVQTLYTYAGGEYGEFGIDLAIDENGHPWILEVNTKPSKSNEDHTNGKVRPSARGILNYCLFLTQFFD